MSVKIVCDGCGRGTPPQSDALLVIALQRTNGRVGEGGLPNSGEDVYWCTTCARVAFAAVAAAAEAEARRSFIHFRTNGEQGK